jgi:DegV family protein with EDD domain
MITATLYFFLCYDDKITVTSSKILPLRRSSMSKVAIVTDSTAYIPQEMLKRYPITVLPQVLIWGEETFRDGVDIQPVEFYTRLAKATVMPSTSQVSPVEFETAFRSLNAQGYEVLAITIANSLSGTMASAIQAKAALDGQPIELVDSNTTAMAMGFQALAAAKAAVRGASLAECKAIAEAAQPRTGVIITVETLEFLHRGGRIGGAQKFLATALNIKPIIEVVEGKLEGVEKVRTRRKALARLVELVGERTGGKKPLQISVVHANSRVDAESVLELAKSTYQVTEGSVTDVSPVIGTHVGPGTVGVCWMVED